MFQETKAPAAADTDAKALGDQEIDKHRKKDKHSTESTKYMLDYNDGDDVGGGIVFHIRTTGEGGPPVTTFIMIHHDES